MKSRYLRYFNTIGAFDGTYKLNGKQDEYNARYQLKEDNPGRVVDDNEQLGANRLNQMRMTKKTSCCPNTTSLVVHLNTN